MEGYLCKITLIMKIDRDTLKSDNHMMMINTLTHQTGTFLSWNKWQFSECSKEQKVDEMLRIKLTSALYSGVTQTIRREARERTITEG